MRRFIRRAAAGLLAPIALLWSLNLWYAATLPDQYYVSEGEALTLTQNAVAVQTGEEAAQPAALSTAVPRTQTLSLFGIMPIKSVSVEECESICVIPSGTAFGVKMFSQGAVVVGFNPVATADGTAEPYADTGIAEGDLICAVNGEQVSRNEEIAYRVRQSEGNPITLTLRRGESEFTVTVTPALCSTDDTYKTGLWIRDSAAGIGTITFYDPSTGLFAGLGHPITDPDTGTILPVKSGEVCPVSIHSIQKGTAGTPGELDGVFSSNVPLGEILLNDETGVYGSLSGLDFSGAQPMELGYKQEVETGKATILCALTDETPQEYEIEICAVNLGGEDDTKNLVLRVTDPALLEKTGGIVQGMSGSPILQNGKLVGAVTHVFVNDPTMGYGIFAETMVSHQEQLAS